MGVLLGSTVSTSWQKTNQPWTGEASNGEATAETIAAYDKVRRAMTAQYEKLSRDNPLWDPEPVQMITGYDIPEFEPRVVTIRRRPNPVPDVISTGIGWLVSDKVRNEIERIELGRHRFLPTILEWTPASAISTAGRS
jgi:hypothetical protein